MSAILVTGGSGYIGSHTLVELLNVGYEVVVYDNLSNSSKESLESVFEITGKEIIFYEGDIRDAEKLTDVFQRHSFDAVLHFAGLKAVGESSAEPILYYENNVYGTLQLVKVMCMFDVKNIVFSSSATIYGVPVELPLRETSPIIFPTNPYGKSKLIIENMLEDLAISDPDWSVISLRYFNPIGAHETGLIGENSRGTPSNLMPIICQVATGVLSKLPVLGNDYNTPDGTGVRDYVHVVDLAKGHLNALSKVLSDNGEWKINLGTGKGYSVLDIVNAFEVVSGKHISLDFLDRRPGDVDSCFADPTYAKDILDWTAIYDLEKMCEDAWRWVCKNPNGF
jgi:UDP-glucose 4-epimerase